MFLHKLLCMCINFGVCAQTLVFGHKLLCLGTNFCVCVHKLKLSKHSSNWIEFFLPNYIKMRLCWDQGGLTDIGGDAQNYWLQIKRIFSKVAHIPGPANITKTHWDLWLTIVCIFMLIKWRDILTFAFIVQQKTIWKDYFN